MATSTLKNEFRQIGLLFLLHSIAIIYGVFAVSSIIGISGTYQSAANTSMHEMLFRTGICSRLVSTILSIFIALALYNLLQKVNKFQARLMLLWMLLVIPFQFIGEAFNITSVMVANGGLLQSADTNGKHNLVLVLQNIYNNINSISQCFWGLWLFPFGILIYESKFIAKSLAVFAVLGGLCYLVDYIAFLFFPAMRSVTVFALLAGFLTEILFMCWFLFSKTHIIDNSLNTSK